MLRVEEVPLALLKLNGRNYRTITEPRMRHLRRTIVRERELLEVRPVIARLGSNVVLAGNQRVRAALAEGWETIPAVFMDVDDARAAQIMFLDNASFGEVDYDLAADLLAELEAAGGDLDLTGFTRAETAAFLRRAAFRDRDADALPTSVPKKPKTKPGTILELGPHRVMYGSATNRKHVQELLGDARPRLLATDPPYGIALDNRWREHAGLNSRRGARTAAHQATSLAADERSDWGEAFALVPSATVAYVWHASRHACVVQAGLEQAGFEVRQQLIWDKGAFALSRQHYHWSHEPAFFAVRVGASVPWLGPRNQSTVWKAASPKMVSSGNGDAADAKVDHATQKPVALFTRPIENHLEPGEWVYDPFGGSGTSLIAAELTGRRALVMEIDPRCCDLIRARYEEFVGDR
jgi:DNA modification methylase